jgi:hypothetical protein
VTGLIHHPLEAGLTYARTDMGGAYRWAAARSAWLPITDFLGRDEEPFYGILSLAVDPSDTERVYLMSGKYTASWAGNGAVLSSSDRGQSFSITRLGIKVGGNEDGRGAGERLAVDPNLGTRLFMGTTRNGLWKSDDRAASFQRVASFTPSNVNFVRFHGGSGTQGSATPRIIVGVASTTQSLWHSTDAGATWTAVAGQPTSLIALRTALTGTNLYIAYADSVGPNGATTGAVYRYDLSSEAWADVSPPKGGYGFGGVTVDAKNPSHLVVSTLNRWWPNDELYRSTNGGSSWVKLLENAAWDRSKAPYTSSSSPHWLADVALDPFDSDRVSFVTGYGIWMCRLAHSPVSCSFENTGLEQTVPLQIVSPKEGAPLLSAMGDIDGFRHDSLEQSPPQGRFSPNMGTTRAITNAGALPLLLAKTHDKAPFAALSKDGGSTWRGVSAQPSGATGGGTRSIALSADGSTIVWSPAGAAMSYSRNEGSSWTACGGSVPRNLAPLADRVDAQRFYAFDPAAGHVFVSNDAGSSFAVGATGLPSFASWEASSTELAAVPDHAGALWLALGSHGLRRSTDGGASFSSLPNVSAAFRVGFGKPQTGLTYPAVFVWGTVSGVTGIFRSEDEGASFVRINDDAHQFGGLHAVIGDPRVYGRVYVATEGRGILYRDEVPPE